MNSRLRPIFTLVRRELRRAAWLLLLLTALLALPRQAQAQAPAGICDRTPQVRDAILDRIGGGAACGDVTAAQLEAITGKLDLNNQGASKIANLKIGDFDGLANLETLDLSYNYLTALPEGVFRGLTDLQDLDLSSNVLTTLPEGLFQGLTNLLRLDLSIIRLTALPVDVFSGLSNLQVLYLGGNRLTALPADVFSSLSELQQLTLSGNALTTLPDGMFSNLSNLQALGLSSNSLTVLPADAFRGLSNLQGLGLSSNSLRMLSADTFRGLSNLQSLSLFGSTLTALPVDVFSSLTNLRELYLGQNFLATLPDGVFNGLSNLLWLDLQQNILTTLPADAFRGLTNLETLFLHSNSLTTLSTDGFRGLSNLQYLDLQNNSLTTLPAGGLRGLTHLQILNLQFNRLTMLPATAFQDLSNLERLDLHHNALTTLPEAVFQDLSNLEWLDLSHNALMSLPAAVFRGLTNLRRIDLQYNALTILPEAVFQDSTQLERLDLSHNALTSLPAAVFQDLTNLKRLYLNWNLLTTLPGALLDDLQARVGLRGYLSSNPGFLGPGPFDFARTGTGSFSLPNLGGWSITSNGTETTTQEGYGRIRADAGSTTPSGIAIIGYRPGGVLVAEAGVPASEPVQEGRIFAEVNGPVNTGLALVNPNDAPATIDFYFTDTDGARFAEGAYVLDAGRQIADFLNETPFNGGDTVLGTFTFTSSLPIAVIALRGFTNRDGEFLMTTLPVAPLAAPLTPFTTDTANTGTVYFPHFADGSGWATQVILVNPTVRTIAGTVEFLGQGSATTAAAPAVRTLEDGRTGSSFDYSIPPNGSYRIVTSNPPGGVSVGSVRAIPDDGHRAPSGLVIFSYTFAGKTVLEAGVPALAAGSAFRVYVESSGTPEQAGSIRTGLAITNAADAVNTVALEVTNLDGTLAAPPAAPLTLPPSGQVSRFIDELFDSLPPNFSGVLSVTSTAEVAVVGLRLRYNRRGELKMTTTPPSIETGSPTMADRYFPHIVDSRGWSTQFILFSGTAGQTSSGTLSFIDTAGEPWDLPTTNGLSEDSASPD